MLISIIIPVRNEAEKIRFTIKSCLNQKKIDMNQIEIIIADGNSTDGTSEILKLFSKENKCIKIVFNQDKYMPHGFNKALTIATGKYIMLMSGHSIIEEDYLFNCLKVMSKRTSECVSGLMDTIQDNYIGKIISVAQSTPFGVGSVAFRTKISGGRYVETGVFGFYNAKIFLEIGGMDEELIKNQDDEFNFRLIQNNGKIWLDESIKSKYYSRSSLTKLFKQYYFYGLYKVRVFQKRKGIISNRQLVPAIFVISILISGILKLFINDGILFSFILITYGIINLVFSIISIINRRLNLVSLFILQIAYFIIHLSYGLGFISGLIYFVNKWGSTKTFDNNFNKLKFAKNHQ